MKPHVSRSQPSLIVPPGPTDYTPYKESPSPNGSFPKTRRWLDGPVGSAPSPVSYWHTKRDNDERAIQPRGQPKFSVVKRDADFGHAGPGPADYSPQKDVSPSRGTMPKTRRWRDEQLPGSPGPVSYWHTQRANQERAIQPRASPKFSSVKRNSDPDQPVPGPADYSPIRSRGPPPRGSFPKTRRWRDEALQGSPSPVSYWHTKRDNDERSIQPRGQPKFSIVKRDTDLSHAGPGPADYSPQKDLPPLKGSFPRTRRWQDASAASPASPGPVSYWHTQRDFGTRSIQPRASPKFSVVPRDKGMF